MPAKVYDRPEGQSKSPLLIVVGVIVLILLAFGVYRWKFAGNAAQPNTANTPVAGQSSLDNRAGQRAAMVRQFRGIATA